MNIFVSHDVFKPR